MATEKQVNYLLYLLEKSGFDVRYMNAQYKRLGATMNERSGSVRDWLNSLTVKRASDLIKILLDGE
jgi:hypothetical protein